MYFAFFVFVILVVFVSSFCAAGGDVDSIINSIKERANVDPGLFVKEMQALPFSAIVRKEEKKQTVGKISSSSLPLVFLHGMGDSCFNRGMKNLAEESGAYFGVYSTCIPTGESWLQDTLNGFIMDMNTNVDTFAEKVFINSH